MIEATTEERPWGKIALIILAVAIFGLLSLAAWFLIFSVAGLVLVFLFGQLKRALLTMTAILLLGVTGVFTPIDALLAVAAAARYVASEYGTARPDADINVWVTGGLVFLASAPIGLLVLILTPNFLLPKSLRTERSAGSSSPSGRTVRGLGVEEAIDRQRGRSLNYPGMHDHDT